MNQPLCLVCHSLLPLAQLNLGEIPLTSDFRKLSSEDSERIPLSLSSCSKCGHVQLLHRVEPAKMFREDYPYYSSFSSSLLEQSRAFSEVLVAERSLGPRSFVVEVGSNDGYLLRWFKEQGVRVLGLDPSRGPARVSESLGIPTLVEFFTEEIAERVSIDYGQADVLIAKNVLAHQLHLHSFVKGLATVLKTEGQLIIEVPYLYSLLEHGVFDTIYHEHYSYFSFRSLEALFLSVGLHIVMVEKIDTQGGSLRLTFSRNRSPQESVEKIRNSEKSFPPEQQCLKQLSQKMKDMIQEIREHLLARKIAGESVAAYGASAKGVVLASLCGLDSSMIDFVVDKNPKKQGCFLPGTNIPILDPSILKERKPENLFLFSWNLKDEILRQESSYHHGGGRVIIPLPELHTV